MRINFRKLLVLVALVFFGRMVFAQDVRTVSGIVTDKESNQPLQGVSVLEVGTKNGVSTDAQGKFTIKVKPGTKLSFTYVSYVSQTATYGGQQSLDVALTPEANNLSEVVVTALGIKKDKKTLTYATQTVDTKSLAKAREPNIANSLSGRVAGLDITRSSSGVSGSTRIVLRGERSLTGNSQALVVVDGVPINNNYYSFAQPSPGNAVGGRDQSDGISSINPDDIESINVLKGASAAALYGSRASNGALIITTRKGSGKKGLGVNFSSSTQIEQAMMLRDFQQVYGQGNQGKYIPTSESAWGARLDGSQVPTWSIRPEDAGKTVSYSSHPDNFKDFYDLGYNLTNGISLNGSTDHTNAYFSYTNTMAKGIVSNNQLKRHNLNLRVGGDLGSDKFSYDAKLTYLYQRVDNALRTGESFDNVNRQIIRVPGNISLNDLKNYSFRDASGNLKQNYWNPTSNGGENPYWILNNTPTLDERNRVTGFAAFNYKILPNLNLMLRSGFDNVMDSYDLRWFNNTYIIAPNGNYQVGNNNTLETNNDLLLTYNAKIGEDWTIDANAGANIQHNNIMLQNTNNGQLVYPNFFNTGNALQSSTSRSVYEFEKQSVYATADVAYKKYLILNLTGRVDRSSTLPEQNNTYPFGSIGLTAVLSDMVKMPDFISFAKLRGSWSLTGNDADPYQVPFNGQNPFSTLPGGAGTIVLPSTTLFNAALKPERTTGYEAGFDVDFIKGRIGLSATYYNSNTFDQLFNVAMPIPSGYTTKYINSGNVNNNGIEIQVDATPVKSGDFAWKTTLNYSRNNNKVLSISDGLSEFVGTSDFMNTVKAVVGRPFGELYSRGYERNDKGDILVDSNTGLPIITAQQSVYLGNTRPKWIGGWSNSFSYKNWSLSLLITARIGGVVSSLTNAIIDGDGLTARTLEGREGYVFNGVYTDGSRNTKTITAEQFYQAVGGRNTPIGEVFTYDASNIRLREAVISYSLPEELLKNSFIKGATFSLTGRNLFFFMNKAQDFDSESVVGSKSTSVGLESFGLPPTRLYGLDIRFNF